MKIALVGFGKMGHMLASAAERRGHEIVLTADPSAADASVKSTSPAEIAGAVTASGVQGIIEFTHPSSVLGNIRALLPTGIPLVVGTTGWNDSVPEIKALAEESRGYLLHSANFSLGVNLFYRIVAEAARLFAEFDEYDEAVFEAHHNKKADSPSGTALEIASVILRNCPRKTEVVTGPFDRPPRQEELHVASLRVGAVPGTHTVVFDSVPDTIELTHRARSREGLALGAVRGLEWLVSAAGSRTPGLFTMDDVFADM
ncbi:MAG: 4-hydroxy-tetrahydrodipicolinate reductase [Spirochaetaceae bacterium]|jgi:4-hydroxy-tetrahydrodipicolinate reductase|nr:4-hydroxy-tetrahydrodipicolinate reductase [Spirochaetaceae bacterium]